MPEDNLDRLHRHYQGWAAGDMSDASIFDPYAVVVVPDPHPVPQYGSEGLGNYMRRFLGSFDDVRFEAVEYRVVGDSFVVRVHRSATGKGSGVPLEDHAFHVWTFRGGKAIRMEVIEREAEALEAVGLEE